MSRGDLPSMDPTLVLPGLVMAVIRMALNLPSRAMVWKAWHQAYMELIEAYAIAAGTCNDQKGSIGICSDRK
jgi:hypothetical protein